MIFLHHKKPRQNSRQYNDREFYPSYAKEGRYLKLKDEAMSRSAILAHKEIYLRARKLLLISVVTLIIPFLILIVIFWHFGLLAKV